jgi:hypothetical protein
MKTFLSLLFAAGLGSAAVFGQGCQKFEPEGLPESAMFEYDVAPELVPAFEAAADRIQWASGVVLVNVEGGTPVNLLDESPQGSCADTYVTGWRERGIVSDVQIDLYPPVPGCYSDLSNVLVHELIHSLRRYIIDGEEDMGHTETGVFQAVANKPILNADSLNAICEAVTCTQYNPEE